MHALGFLGLALAAATAGGEVARPALGRDLPPGAINVVEARDAVELCQESVFPAELLADDVPAGHRLKLAAEPAARPWARSIAGRDPRFANHATGVFCFIEAEFRVAGEPLYADGRGTMAFWWVDISDAGPEQPDPRYKGASTQAQAAYIYDAAGVDRELALAATPNALFGRVQMSQEADGWVGSLDTADGHLRARIVPTSARRPLEYATPAYITVPWVGPTHRDYFNVITYMGHHEQEALGEWTATGEARWARLFARDPAARHRTMIQDGVSANLALYRRARPPG
jgi:hypothetical protein